MTKVPSERCVNDLVLRNHDAGSSRPEETADSASIPQ